MAKLVKASLAVGAAGLLMYYGLTVMTWILYWMVNLV